MQIKTDDEQFRNRDVSKDYKYSFSWEKKLQGTNEETQKIQNIDVKQVKARSFYKGRKKRRREAPRGRRKRYGDRVSAGMVFVDSAAPPRDINIKYLYLISHCLCS